MDVFRPCVPIGGREKPDLTFTHARTMYITHTSAGRGRQMHFGGGGMGWLLSDERTGGEVGKDE